MKDMSSKQGWIVHTIYSYINNICLGDLKTILALANLLAEREGFCMCKGNIIMKSKSGVLVILSFLQRKTNFEYFDICFGSAWLKLLKLKRQKP